MEGPLDSEAQGQQVSRAGLAALDVPTWRAPHPPPGSAHVEATALDVRVTALPPTMAPPTMAPCTADTTGT